MARILTLTSLAVLAIVFFYLSRFWFLDLWPRGGLFGIEELDPRGELLLQWLRGTEWRPFELLIWGVGVFLVLTVLQKLGQLFGKRSRD